MSQQIINLLIQGIGETVQMTVISTIASMIIGIPLGVILVVTSKGHILANKFINTILGAIVNAPKEDRYV